MLEEVVESEVDAYVVPALCSTCGEREVQVAVHYRLAARCSDCIRAGRRSTGAVLEPAQAAPGRAYAIPPRPAPVVKAAVRVIPPQHTSRDPWPEGLEEAPDVVMALAAEARRVGWECTITYSRGVPAGSRKVRDTFALRLSKGSLRAVAVRDGDAWGDMWGVAHMVRLGGLGQMREYLRLVGTDLADAYVRKLKAGQRAAAERARVEVRCTDDGAHAGHAYANSKGEARACPGREKAKVTRAATGGKREAGG